MTLMIRQMMVQDYDGVKKLLEKEGMIDERFTRDLFIQRTVMFGPYSYVADVGKKVVGTVFGSHDCLTGHINKLAVEKDFRQNSIGYNLLRACASSLLDDDLRPIYFHTKPDNNAMLELSSRLGFQVNKERLLVDLVVKNREEWKRAYPRRTFL